MTAILSQMDDRHYSTYIETFSGTTDLVVSTNAQETPALAIANDFVRAIKEQMY